MLSNIYKSTSLKYILTLSRKITFLLVAIILLAPTLFAYADDDIYQSATEYDYPPFSVTSEGVADGFSVDLLKAVAAEIGIDITFKIDEWATIKQELADGTLDVLPLVGYNEERDEYFDFSVPYIVMHGNIFIRKGSAISTIDDLHGKQILVMRGDNAQEYAERMNFTDELILTDTYTEAFELLASGQYDAVIAQNLVGQIIIDKLDLNNVVPATSISEKDNSIIKTHLEGFEQKFCFAVKEGDSELLAVLNEGLAIVSANGTYHKLYEKWFPFLVNTQPTFWEALQSSLVFIIPFIILLLVFAVLFTRRQVNIKGHELEESNKTLLTLEAQLINKQKLESIGILASGVAHEINNPLNGILNYSQLIKDATLESLHSEQTCIDVREFSDEIMTETRRISEIVKNLLQFSRNEKKNHSKAEVASIIKGVLSLISVIVKKNSIILSMDIEADLPTISCRTQQIQQILINLISNASDALNAKYPSYDENKKITIHAKKYKLGEVEAIRITVEDNGNGIPKDLQPHIFVPFFTTKDRTEGTGLGLSISYNIAIEHGGMLSYETADGEYTRFHLDLPMRQAKDNSNILI